MVSYVKPLKELRLDAEILDLEIWPNRYVEYRSSEKTWTEFVYAHPTINKASPQEINLDLLDEKPAQDLPAEYNLVAPFGISQGHKRNPLEIIVEARKKLGEKNFFVLCPEGTKINGLECYTAPSISEMARAIRGATELWCIDSSPMVIAKAVRKDKKVMYFPQTLEPYNKDNNEIWDTVELG
jgi:ADP-heptose:LPS heptosyltransferase